jgi:hypothetical protein
MTFEKAYTLLDVVDEGLLETNSAPTRDVVNWIIANRRYVLDDNCLTLYGGALADLVRMRRKKKEPGANPETRNLCFDFGLETLPLPDEISVPTDMDNLPYCACAWKEIDEATIDDLDKHLALLTAQIELNMSSRANFRILRQAASRIVPGRTDIALRELRKIARQGK